jgi:SAM-dependent methyltransferase
MTQPFASIGRMSQQQVIFAGSDAYERFMGRWSRRLAPLLLKLASVDERDSVLDIGSGNGALAFALAEAIPSACVTGVDPAGAYTASLTEARRAALEARLRGRLLVTGQDGPFILQARAWAVRGVVLATIVSPGFMDVSYRGYGRSGGVPSEDSLYEDGLAAGGNGRRP